MLAVRCTWSYSVEVPTQPTEKKKKIPNARSRSDWHQRYVTYGTPLSPILLAPPPPPSNSSKQQAARSHAPPSQAVLYAVRHPCPVDQPAKPAALLPSLVPRPPSCPPADPWAVRHPTIAAGITSSAVRLLPPPCVGSSGPACYRALRNRPFTPSHAARRPHAPQMAPRVRASLLCLLWAGCSPEHPFPFPSPSHPSILW